MKTKILFVCVVMAGIFLVSCKSGEKNNVLTAAEEAEGWKLLFDGKTLNGWRDYNGDSLTAPWTVEDGTIRALGGGSDASGYIVTDEIYENFELVWDWKIAEGGNSGVLYHVVEHPKFNVPYITGPEYQLIDEENFPEPLEEWQKTAADYAMYVPDPSKKKLKPAGEWNTSKIVFDNGHVEYWLNGEKVLEFEAWTDEWFERKNSGKWKDAPEYGLAHKGVICLQDHGSAAWFRNLKIKELPRKTKEVTLFNGVDLHGWEVYGTEKWYVQDGVLVCESGPEKNTVILQRASTTMILILLLSSSKNPMGIRAFSFVRLSSPARLLTVGKWKLHPKGMIQVAFMNRMGEDGLFRSPTKKKIS